jgi:TolB-like protein/DNA-binding winged helix-turn-helix (wHTH) protein
MKGRAATYRFGKFTLQTGDRRLSSDGHEIYLRPKTYDTLLYLLERQGHLVTKNELLDALWAGVAVTENALTRCIKETRAALGDDVQNPEFLRTIPRLGYEFIADVERFGEPVNAEEVEEEFRAVRVVTTEEDSDGHPSEPVAAGDTAAVSTPRGLLPLPARSKWTIIVGWLAGLVLVSLVVSLAVNFPRLRDRLLGGGTSPRITSLAVLPLQNLTGDPQQDYFVDGMTEELITTVGKIRGLRVISRTSVMRYKRTDKPLTEIAKDLNVDAVVEGAVLRAGDRVRITAQLIQASTDRHLWAETYDRNLRDVLTLQSEVARDIAGEIKSEVAPQKQERLASQRPVNPEAYALYLQGRALRGRDTDGDNRAAIASLARAVAIDPNFAPAYAALGGTYANRLFGWEPKDKWEKKAEAAIDRALSLDPDLAEAHASRAALLFTPAHGWQYEDAIQECRRALALNPNLAEGHLTLGVVFEHVGLLDEALQEFRTAAAISPALADAGLYTGFTLMFSGKFQDSLPFIRSYPVSPFSRSILAYGLWESGQKGEAWDLVRELLKADPQEKFVYLASFHTLLLAESGKGREAERRIHDKILKEAESMKPYGHFHHVANIVADIYAQLNKPEEAVVWLERTAATGFPCYPFFEHDRSLDPIRQDPRFVAFMQKLKPQWEHLKSKYGSSAAALAFDSQ